MIDKELPSFAIPYTENELPSRHSERIDILDPRVKKSMTDAPDPSFCIPYSEQLEPRRQKLRIDIVLPKLM
jgi:hypothetical protein